MNRDILENSVILVGPPACGKSTISRRLQKELDLEEVSIDRIRNAWRHEHKKKYNELDKYKLVIGALSNLKRPSVISFGGGDGMFRNKTLQAMFNIAISKFPHVIELGYSEDKNETIEELYKRACNDTGRFGPAKRIDDEEKRKEFIEDNKKRIKDDLTNIVMNNHFSDFCTTTIYTKGLTPDEVCEEVLKSLSKNDKKSK